MAPARALPSLSPAQALVPLRAFLGATYVYAGVQKLSDPGFLHPGAQTYIGTQLHGFADGTPGGWLLRTFALPHSELAGIAAALKGRPPSPRRPAVHDPGPAGVPAGAVRVAGADELPAGTSTLYRDPADGLPDVVVRQPSGSLTSGAFVRSTKTPG